MRSVTRLSCAALTAALLTSACGNGGDLTGVDVQYHSASQRIRVLLTRELSSGETLHARLRRGEIGDARLRGPSGSIDRIDGARVSSAASPTFEGPPVSRTTSRAPTAPSGSRWSRPRRCSPAIADGQSSSTSA